MSSYKVKTKIDFKALKYANLYLMKVKRKSYLIFSVLCAACVFGAVYSAVTGGMNNIIFIVIFALFAVYAVYSMLTFEKKVDNSLLKYFASNAPITQYIGIDENNISICLKGQDKLEKVTYDWAYVNEVNELNEYYLLFLSGGMPIIIKRDSECVMEGTMEEIEALIKEKAALKPYKVYTKELVKNFVDPVNYIEAAEDDIEAIIEKLNEEPVQVTVEEKTEAAEEEKEQLLEEPASEEKAEESNEEEAEETNQVSTSELTDQISFISEKLKETEKDEE